MTAFAAIAAWLGGSIVLLSDGRRGLALGLAIAAAGLGGVVLLDGDYAEAAALGAGGALATALCISRRPAGWAMVPPGSTPRLILAIVIALLSLWLATVVTSSGDAALRFAVPAILGVSALRLLTGADAAASTAAASAAALALGAGALLAGDGAGLAACIVGALVAVGLQAIPQPQADGA